MGCAKHYRPWNSARHADGISGLGFGANLVSEGEGELGDLEAHEVDVGGDALAGLIQVHYELIKERLSSGDGVGPQLHGVLTRRLQRRLQPPGKLPKHHRLQR
jgi:hypothetical protein